MRDRAMEMRRHFHVHRQHICPGVHEVVQVTVWLLDHQVHIERACGDPLDGADDRLADRDVRDEVAVHDVDMNLVGAAPFRRGDRVAQNGEIRRENGGRDPDRHRLTSSEIDSPGAI